jgi:rubrerythrin
MQGENSMETVQIFDFAMQMEKDGEAFYRRCAEGTGDKGVAGILNRLAEAEVIHYKVLDAIKHSRAADMPAGTIDAHVKNLFRDMLDSGDTFGGEGSELDLYKRAQEMERKSREFYLREADNVESPHGKELFLRIADEEQLHIDYIGSIIEFVQRAEPGNWLEDAEWYHNEDY